MLLILESAGRRYYVPLPFSPFAISCLPIKVFIFYSSSFSSSKRPLAVVLPNKLLYEHILFQAESRVRFILIINDAVIIRINEVVHRCHISCIFLFLLEQIFFLTYRLHFILLGVFWGVIPCDLIDLYHRFGRVYYLHLQETSLVAEEIHCCNFSRQMWA
jgi:hypothetical protein